MKLIGIYKITSPSKKIYIGQSTNIIHRFLYYKRLYCKTQTRLYRSFLKYGVEKHKFEILSQCEAEQLNELEKYYVDLYQTFNSKFGLNIRDGGGSRGRHSVESKRKISLANKGNNYCVGTRRTVEQKKNMKTAQIKVNHNGSRNRNSKLKESDVLQIRLLSKSITQKEITKNYPINNRSVSNIILRKSWKHI